MGISFLSCVAGLALIVGTTTLHAQGANNGADLKSLLSDADTDGDGVLSQSEMTALYDLVQGRNTGRTNLPGILRPGSTRTNAGTIRRPPTAPSRTPVPVPPPATQPAPAQTNRVPVVRPPAAPPSSTPQTKPTEKAGERHRAITSERDYEAEKRRIEKDYESAKKDLERNYEAAKRDLEKQWEDSKDDRRDKPGRGDERGKGKGKGKAKGWDKDRD